VRVREGLGMNLFIVDTTLRDGEQKAGLAFGMAEKVRIAKILDYAGVYQIEAGIPAMGDEEKQSIQKIAELGLGSRISAWNRLNPEDIRQSMDCGADILHISVPSSDIQIQSKLRKDRKWILEQVRRCVCLARSGSREVTIGLEDASRADFGFLLQVISTACKEGVKRIRYADTVGILYKKRIFEEIREIRNELKVEIEIHTHNDMGMAVSNSLAAAEGGAAFVDCTAGGIGERAGNCNYLKFVKAARACLGVFCEVDELRAYEAQKNILDIINRKKAFP
jgi:homocitrate synthase NifV